MAAGDEQQQQQRRRSGPHVVCFPCPAQGHINGMMQLAKLLHSKGGCYITFVHTEFNYDRILSLTGASRPSLPDDFRFETIPDGLPARCHTVRDSAALCVAIRTNFSSPFRKLLKRLNGEECPDVPPITCVVSDSITSFTLDVSEELGVPNLFFHSASACGFMGCLQLKELIGRGLVPLKSESDLTNGYLDTPVDWIPGMMRNTRLRDLPSFIRTTDRNETILNFLIDEFRESFRATAIVLNTFDELEGAVLEAMSEMQLPPMYTIGPMTLLSQPPAEPIGSSSSTLWEEDSLCIEWLGGREPGSVLYMNLGSSTVLTNQQLEEFAWGVANSGQDFLLVIRPDLADDISAVLSDEFVSKTRDRGLVTNWCRQEEVLMHSAIGGFLTHCGWNSVLESLSAGVPMICWPFFADQQGNCRYMCTEWGIGVEVGDEVRREDVERVIREMMRGDKGREMRRKALEWKESAVRATGPGGSSFMNLEAVISEVILKNKQVV